MHEQEDLGLLGPFPCAASPVASLFVYVLRSLLILCSTKDVNSSLQSTLGDILNFPYPRYNFLNPFFVTLHFQKRLNLAQGKIFPVT